MHLVCQTSFQAAAKINNICNDDRNQHVSRVFCSLGFIPLMNQASFAIAISRSKLHAMMGKIGSAFGFNEAI